MFRPAGRTQHHYQPSFSAEHTKLTQSRRLIAHPKDRMSNLQDVQTLPFFQSIPFQSLRERDAPFVPMLDGETDVGYFDSFESEADMAKYAEVFKKQRDVAAVEEKGMGARDNWVGFTFGRHAQVSRECSLLFSLLHIPGT